MQDSEYFNYKTRHHNDGAERKSKESKTMWIGFKRHNDESNYQRDDADNHQLIIFLSEREFAFHVCFNRVGRETCADIVELQIKY